MLGFAKIESLYLTILHYLVQIEIDLWYHDWGYTRSIYLPSACPLDYFRCISLQYSSATLHQVGAVGSSLLLQR